MKKNINKKAEPAIEIRNISKEFLIPKLQNNSLKQAIVHGFKKSEKIRRQVLDDVSFTINKGDFFGIVGRNGSGKSTLLKLICGIYTPTSGEIIKHGDITPFIELGVGFNPELSGRDNVYLNGALLGFDRKQMSAMYDEIVDFAELHEFMDLKLKNFSSGMQVRLAFSIAIKSKSLILVFDEVLAVGDEAFQRKCLDVFEEYKASGQTVVLVTHDMDTVKKFCNRAVLINDSRLTKAGNPIEVADEYSRLNEASISTSIVKEETNAQKRDGGGLIRASLLNKRNKQTNIFNVYDRAILRVKWKKDPVLKTIMIDMFKKSGEHVTGFKMFEDDLDEKKVDFSKIDSIKVELPLDFSPGKYYFKIGLRSDMDTDLFVNYECGHFVIKKPDYVLRFSGLSPVKVKWLIDK